MPLSSLSPGSLLLLETPPLDVWGQMALDEWLLDLDEPSLCLRFHRWAGGPAASFGYSRPFAAVEAGLPPHLRAHGTRRLTGGGVSRHGSDVGFSCVLPYPTSTWNPVAVRRVLNEAIGRGFQNLGLEVCLVATPLPPSSRRAASHPFFRQAIDLELTALDGSRILHVAMCHRRDRVLCQATGEKRRPVKYHVPEELFPEDLPKKQRQEYIAAALSYIRDRNIDPLSL